jgi:hypothetical protein
MLVNKSRNIISKVSKETHIISIYEQWRPENASILNPFYMDFICLPTISSYTWPGQHLMEAQLSGALRGLGKEKSDIWLCRPPISLQHHLVLPKTWLNKCHENFCQSMDLGNLKHLTTYLMLNMPCSDFTFHFHLLLNQLEDPESMGKETWDICWMCE